MLLYGISGMGVNLLNLMMGSYLCSAVLIGGFGEDAIKNQTFAGVDLVVLAVWSTFVLISKILDGIIDIPMASFADNLKTRFGRRRPAILIGLIPMIIAYVLFLFVPNPASATLLNTVYLGIVLCIFYSFYTLTMVTYYATFTEIVDNESDRMFISNVKSVCDIFYFIIGYVVVRILLNGMNIKTVALIVLPCVLTMLIPIFLIKETRDSIGATGRGETVNLVKSISHTCKNKPFIIWMLVYALMTFGVQLFLGGINEYFSKVGISMIIVMSCSFAPVPFTLILYNKLVKSKGFGFAFRYILLTYGAGMLMMFFVGFMTQTGVIKTVLSIIAGIICSFAVGALFSVAYSVPSQLAAEEEEKTGISNSAMYFAVQGLFSGVASGIATGVVLVALKGSEAHPTDAMKYMTLICAIAMAVAFAASYILPKSLTVMGKKSKDNN